MEIFLRLENIIFYPFKMKTFLKSHCMNSFEGTAQLVQKVTFEPMMDFKQNYY